MADLYVFPTKYNHKSLPKSYNEIGAIDLPLSILEAMACNLPLIATPFGALPRIFREGNSFFYFQDVNDLLVKLEEAKGMKNVGTRLMVKSYDWNEIVEDLNKLYEELIS